MKNNRGAALIVWALLIGTISSSIGAYADQKTGGGTRTHKILIAYFSRVGSSESFAGVDAVSSASLPNGNTITIAKMIQKEVGGDMFQIVTAKPYPANYRATTDVAQDEQKKNARPKLATRLKNVADYDIVFVGYPDWWGTIPMPLFSFFEEYDFSGKTIIPFCTHEGSGLGSSERDIAKICPKSKIAEGLAVRGSGAEGAQDAVKKWIKGLGI